MGTSAKAYENLKKIYRNVAGQGPYDDRKGFERRYAPVAGAESRYCEYFTLSNRKKRCFAA